jgi:hypothetical protein
MTPDRRGSLLSFLHAVHRRPGMYTGADAGNYGAHMDRLEMLISGYIQAVLVHGIQDPGVDLYAEFAPCLEIPPSKDENRLISAARGGARFRLA